ncbi:MAG: zinc ribbon domain-containing protein [Firmicutes bacterium]|nr:zinc ribbon domain-containing protein [Bacillota bacterium]
MPIYEFRCAKCQERFERLCPVGETGENLSCPRCGEQRPVRVLSTFSSRGTSGGTGGGCASCSSTSCSSCH